MGVSWKNQSLAHQAIDLLIPWGKHVKIDTEALYSLGQAFRVVKQPEFAVRSRMLVLDQQPTHEDSLESLAIHDHQANDLKQARMYCEKLPQVNPSRSNSLRRVPLNLWLLDFDRRLGHG